MSENVLAELRAGKQYLRRLFSEAFQWIDTWLDELKDLIKKEAGAQEMGRPDAQRAREAETKQKRVDEHMRCACNLHAHAILMLRNVDLEEDGPSTVCKLLSSFAFLSMHHTFNLQDGLDIPEPELFEIYHRHRRHLIVWFENRMEKKEYKNFNSVLQTVHEQFSALDAASSIDTAEFEWGSIGGDVHNAAERMNMRQYTNQLAIVIFIFILYFHSAVSVSVMEICITSFSRRIEYLKNITSKPAYDWYTVNAAHIAQQIHKKMSPLNTIETVIVRSMSNHNKHTNLPTVISLTLCQKYSMNSLCSLTKPFAHGRQCVPGYCCD